MSQGHSPTRPAFHQGWLRREAPGVSQALSRSGYFIRFPPKGARPHVPRTGRQLSRYHDNEANRRTRQPVSAIARPHFSKSAHAPLPHWQALGLVPFGPVRDAFREVSRALRWRP